MSTKTLDNTIDLRAPRTGPRGILATIALVLSAVNEGREAEGCYRNLTVRGMGPTDAATETFRRHYKS